MTERRSMPPVTTFGELAIYLTGLHEAIDRLEGDIKDAVGNMATKGDVDRLTKAVEAIHNGFATKTYVDDEIRKIKDGTVPVVVKKLESGAQRVAVIIVTGGTIIGVVVVLARWIVEKQ